MRHYFLTSQSSQCLPTSGKTVFVLISITLSVVLTRNTSAITVEEVMENVREVYQNVENYAAVVHTYKADSMVASASLFETQRPMVAFNLFFRKPDEHVVTEISDAPHGIFRIELLSAIGKFENRKLNLLTRDFLLGQECYVLEVPDPDKPGDSVRLWISPQDWTVLQLTIFIKNMELVRTQFKHTPISRQYLLPVETRSFFPSSKQVLINRITSYQINTNLPETLFKERLPDPDTKE
ncbi:MAG: hypothetical protein OYL97_02465 [Candidatus Poribacteria bacterium]|nr:hypothetical protein [Candidatus Poribacteria bacterium]